MSPTAQMPSSASLSNLPVELFEKILEYLDVIDILPLKLVRAPPIIQRFLS